MVFKTILSAELANEAGNDILKQWMRSGTELIASFMLGHVSSFCILAIQATAIFTSTLPPVFSQSVHSGCTPNKLSKWSAVALLVCQTFILWNIFPLNLVSVSNSAHDLLCTQSRTQSQRSPQSAVVDRGDRGLWVRDCCQGVPWLRVRYVLTVFAFQL